MAKDTQQQGNQEKPEAKASGFSTVAPFGIEADHPRNDDLLIQNLTNVRLRSAISGTRQVHRTAKMEPDEEAPLGAESMHVGGLRTPGMQLHVNPQTGTYVVVDVITEDKLERVRKHIESKTMARTATKLKGMGTQEGKLGVDEMKTLCREMLTLVNIGHAKVVAGPQPAQEDIDKLPGDYLLNPGLRGISTAQPRYEKDLEAWKRGADRVVA